MTENRERAKGNREYGTNGKIKNLTAKEKKNNNGKKNNLTVKCKRGILLRMFCKF